MLTRTIALGDGTSKPHQRLLNKPGMDSSLLAQIRARLERVLATLVADGRVWVERPDVAVDLHALLAEIDRRGKSSPGWSETAS
jgi:hypothetical protein